MSYMGPDPGDTQRCDICGLEVFPQTVGDHSACEAQMEERDRRANAERMATMKAEAAQYGDPGLDDDGLPF